MDLSARGPNTAAAHGGEPSIIGRLFRGKVLDGIAKLRAAGELVGADDPHVFAALKDRLYRKDWVTYAKRPFAGTAQVFRYLGRYTHRVGLSDYRLTGVGDDAITWKTRGEDIARVAPVEFIRRMLQHVLPARFVKIRHAGLYAAGNVNTRLVAPRALLDDGSAEPHDEPAAHFDLDAIIAELSALPGTGCPRCGGRVFSHLLPMLRPMCRAPPAAPPS